VKIRISVSRDVLCGDEMWANKVCKKYGIIMKKERGGRPKNGT
jgi:hypothetical protein